MRRVNADHDIPQRRTYGYIQHISTQCQGLMMSEMAFFRDFVAEEDWKTATRLAMALFVEIKDVPFKCDQKNTWRLPRKWRIP